MNFDEIRESARTLNLLATDRTAHLSSRALGLEVEFPIYVGDGYIAINAFDMDKAAELHGCPYFPVGHMVFLPSSCAEISKRLSLLDVIG